MVCCSAVRGSFKSARFSRRCAERVSAVRRALAPGLESRSEREPVTERSTGEHDNAADLDLARRARAGDASAVEVFLRRMRCVRRFLVAKNAQLGRPLGADELEDALQETLFALWRKLGEYQGHGALEAWAYRFSVLELLARLRRLERYPRTVGDVETAADARPREAGEPAPLEPAEVEQLHRLIERLGPQAADVIRLHFLEELTFDQIAARLGVSSNTVKTRFYRGMERLRVMLVRDGAPLAERDA